MYTQVEGVPQNVQKHTREGGKKLMKLSICTFEWPLKEYLSRSEIVFALSEQTTMNEDFSNSIENCLNQSEKAFKHSREEVRR